MKHFLVSMQVCCKLSFSGELENIIKIEIIADGEAGDDLVRFDLTFLPTNL